MYFSTVCKNIREIEREKLKGKKKGKDKNTTDSERVCLRRDRQKKRRERDKEERKTYERREYKEKARE